MQPDQLTLELEGYHQFFNSAEKKGYSGTAIFTKKAPLAVQNGIGIAEHDKEGRVITLDMGEYYFVTTYTPNSQEKLKRLDYRLAWEEAWKAYLNSLKAHKPVIICGDLNVAHTEIDLKNPKTNRKNPGFSDEEREAFTRLLADGYIDTWRYQHPDTIEVYSWWSYRFKAREKNTGWRIDYFLTSEDLQDKIATTTIHTDIFGSDHCPVELVLKDKEGLC